MNLAGVTSVTILYTNCRSILNKTSELLALASDTSPDIIALSETWASEDNDNHQLLPAGSGYSLVSRSDRTDTAGGRGGGVCIMVKSDLAELTSEVKVSINCASTQICAIKVKHIKLYCVYRSPNQVRANDSILCDFLKTVRGDSVLVGDFNIPNINWQTQSSLTKSDLVMEFIESIQEAHLEQKVLEPTHQAGNILDLVLTSDGMIPEDIEVLANQQICDHFPLKMTLNCNLQTPTSTELIYDIGKGDYEKYRTLLALPWAALLSTLDVEGMWCVIRDKIISAFSEVFHKN